MKKTLTVIIAGILTIALVNIPRARAAHAPVTVIRCTPMDTVPMRKGDSTKWNRKKYPDTTQPRRDTTHNS